MTIDTQKLREAAASVRAFLKPEYGRAIAAAADHIDAQAAEIERLKSRDAAAEVALREAAEVISDRNAEIARLRGLLAGVLADDLAPLLPDDYIAAVRAALSGEGK